MDGKLKGNKAPFEKHCPIYKTWILSVVHYSGDEPRCRFQYLFNKYLLSIYCVPGSYFKPWQYSNVQNNLCAYTA